jgi:hypothetical protein
MREKRQFWLVCLGLLLAGTFSLRAQDTVTIPKSRLEELQRAEEELKKLKAQPPATNAPATTIPEQPVAIAPKPAPPPKPVHVSPAMSKLAPLKEEEVVEAVDLANHYRTDPAAADRRYRGKKFLVRGQVAGFEKHIFIRDYKVILQTDDPQLRIICSVFPPQKYKAIFKSSNGFQMIGVMEVIDEKHETGVVSGEVQETLTRLGDTVTIAGECHGLRDFQVVLTGCGLRRVESPKTALAPSR